jgi:hypothetical protein
MRALFARHFLILYQHLAYLIVVVATGNAALQLISIIMLGITYSLQVNHAMTQ